MFQNAENFPKRISKEPIYIQIECENSNFNLFSGKFNYHSVKDKTAVFIRDGEKIERYQSSYPYYLNYHESYWYIQSSTYFNENSGGGWMCLETKGFLLASA